MAYSGFNWLGGMVYCLFLRTAWLNKIYAWQVRLAVLCLHWANRRGERLLTYRSTNWQYTQLKLNACRIYINNQKIKANLQRCGSMGMDVSQNNSLLNWCVFAYYFACLLGFVCLLIILRLMLRLYGCDEPKNENRIADLKNRKRFFLSTKSKLKFDLEIWI